MGLTGKQEVEIPIKSSADKFYKIFRSEAHQIPTAGADHVHAINVHEGDWETKGSVKEWTYNLDGVNPLKVKEKTEEIDDENKCITFSIVDGEIRKEFKSFKTIIQVIPKEEGCTVKWTLDYEKKREDVQDPSAYIELATNLTKAIESHHLKA
ncbi:Bet v I/Major latex protein [Dillenia turbinata]|uniref:Bet v I/Major latex protein n=1 Tax=Dillenia turbinata TaxID=194707 RepID=A0AAN8ZEQ0_9MAGN